MNTLPPFFKCLCIPTIIVLGASVAIFVFVALPLRMKIATESDNIQKIHAKIEHSDRKIAHLPEFEKQVSIVEEDERKISKLLLETQVVDFIEEVESTAESVGGDVSIAQGVAVDVAQKQIPKKTDGDGASTGEDSEMEKTIAEELPREKQLPLKIEFSGEYAKAVNFLHKIETMPYRLDVVSIDIRPFVPDENGRSGVNLFVAAPTDESDVVDSSDSGQPLVSASFNVVVYME